MTNESEIRTAYQKLAVARIELHEAFIANRTARLAYEDGRANIILHTDPKALGSNETIRNAAIDVTLGDELANLRANEAREYAARVQYDTAQIDVKCIETLIAWARGAFNE